MKILVCTVEYPPDYSSGIGNVVYYVVKQFQKIGIECIICSPTGPSVVLCNRSIIKKIYSYKPLYYLYKNLYFWYRASNYIKRNHDKYDIAWLHNPNPISFSVALPKKNFGHCAHNEIWTIIA